MYRIVVRQWMLLRQCIEYNTEWRSHVRTSWYSDIYRMDSRIDSSGILPIGIAGLSQTSSIIFRSNTALLAGGTAPNDFRSHVRSVLLHFNPRFY